MADTEAEESSWWGGIFDTVADTGASLVEVVAGGVVGATDAYAEREIEEIASDPEPVNTANVPDANDNASAIKYNEVAAANAVQEQAAAAAASTATNEGFLTKHGKWLAIGGGGIAVLGVLLIAAKGGR